MHSWEALKDDIGKERDARKNPKHMEDFQNLNKLADRYRQRKGLPYVSNHDVKKDGVDYY
jgi:hypothetical protein